MVIMPPEFSATPFTTAYGLISPFPGHAFVSVTLAETRTGDLPVPQFTNSHLSEEAQLKHPRLIGVPNLLTECPRHLPYSGTVLSHDNRTLHILYAYDEYGKNEYVDNDMRDRLAGARTRLTDHLGQFIVKLDATYRTNPMLSGVVIAR